MALYTGFGTGAPAVTYGADTGAYTMGTAFEVAGSGATLTKGRIYLSSNGGAVTAGDVLSAGNLQFGLFAQNDGLTGDGSGAVGASLFTPVTVSSVTMDAWNEATLPSPYALTAGTVYYASWLMPAGRYSAISHQFDTDVTVGPITFRANAYAVPALGTVRNGAFVSGGAPITAPNVSFNATWYGIDVEVSIGGTSQTGTGNLTLAAALTGAGVASRTATGNLTAVAALTGSGALTLGTHRASSTATVTARRTSTSTVGG